MRNLGLLALALPLAACGNNVDAAFSGLESNRQQTCGCYEELGFTTQEGCVLEFAAELRFTATEQSCLSNLYDANVGTQAYFDCQLEVQQNLTTCLAGVVNPCNASGAGQCWFNAGAGFTACGAQLSLAAAAEVTACGE